MSDTPTPPGDRSPAINAAGVRAILDAAAAPQPPAEDGPTPDPRLADSGLDDDGDRPSDEGLEDVDMAVVEACSLLDASDTDNAERFLRHLGRDYAVIAAAGFAGGDRVVWTGTHWDVPNGFALAQTLASRLGGRIALETRFLGHTPAEAQAIRDAQGLPENPDDDPNLSRSDKGRIRRRARAIEMLARRVARRLNHAVTTKNAGRVESMFAFADPRARLPHAAFNADRMKTACPNGTLHFAWEDDPECPDPDAARRNPVLRFAPAHDRADRITAFVATEWLGMEAPAPKFRAMMARMLPDEGKRRTVRMFAGMALTGVPLQYIMFHFGSGANGKSVFLEVLVRVLGEAIAVGLPRESIVGGGEKTSGSASPDIIRLLFKRMVRILEVKGDAPLQDDLVKRLTGGEGITARALFKGYIEFQNAAKAHMSGNKKPSLDGSDYGTARRLLLVHWDQTIPEGERREFEDVVAELVREEAPGILAWLAEGVLDWMGNGERLFIADSVRADSLAYVEANDPVGEFFRVCVRPDPSPAPPLPQNRLAASELYAAYQNWSLANAKQPRSQKKVGDMASERFQKSEIGGRNYYLHIRLVDVPPPPSGDPRDPGFGEDKR